MAIATSSGIYQDPPGSGGGSGGGGGGGAVSSVFTRIGAVIAQTGDYTAAQVTGALVNTNNLNDVSNPVTALANLGGAPLSTIASTTQSGVSYTFQLTDAGTVVESLYGSATTFIINTHANVAFPTGSVIEVFQFGPGQITISGAVGVTLYSDGSKVRTNTQYSTVGLRQRSIADSWVISGDLS